MKKPKFLQRFIHRKAIRKQKAEYEKWKNEETLQRIQSLEDSLNSIEQKAIQKKVEQRREEDKLTDPFIQDNYEIVYDSKGNYKTVFFNGIPLNGVNSIEIETDGIGHEKALLTLRVFGRINVLTEEE